MPNKTPVTVNIDKELWYPFKMYAQATTGSATKLIEGFIKDTVNSIGSKSFMDVISGKITKKTKKTKPYTPTTPQPEYDKNRENGKDSAIESLKESGNITAGNNITPKHPDGMNMSISDIMNK